MKVNEGKILMLVCGIILGLIITNSIVSTNYSHTTFLTYEEYEKMSLQENELKMELKGINKEIKNLNKKLSLYDSSSRTNDTVLKTLKKELSDEKLFFGASKVKGSGIIITINDKHKKSYADDFDKMLSTTHDTDILYTVYDLKNAGAEAISVNGIRTTSTTSITCEGPVIMINGQYIVPPFRIEAIGDPDALYYAAKMLPESHYKDMEMRGLVLSLVKSSNVIINGMEEYPKLKYIDRVQ